MNTTTNKDVVTASKVKAKKMETVTTKSLEFTPNEAQVLVNLLDIATKAGGLEIAVMAIPLVQKVQRAFAPEEG